MARVPVRPQISVGGRDFFHPVAALKVLPTAQQFLLTFRTKLDDPDGVTRKGGCIFVVSPIGKFQF